MSDLAFEWFDAFRVWLSLTGEDALLDSSLVVREALERWTKSAMGQGVRLLFLQNMKWNRLVVTLLNLS